MAEDRRRGQQVGIAKMSRSLDKSKMKASLNLIHLIVQVMVLARVGHEWSHHCCRFIDMKLLHGGSLGLEGCSPAAYADEANTVAHADLKPLTLG